MLLFFKGNIISNSFLKYCKAELIESSVISYMNILYY